MKNKILTKIIEEEPKNTPKIHILINLIDTCDEKLYKLLIEKYIIYYEQEPFIASEYLAFMDTASSFMSEKDILFNNLNKYSIDKIIPIKLIFEKNVLKFDLEDIQKIPVDILDFVITKMIKNLGYSKLLILLWESIIDIEDPRKKIFLKSINNIIDENIKSKIINDVINSKNIPLKRRIYKNFPEDMNFKNINFPIEKNDTLILLQIQLLNKSSQISNQMIEAYILNEKISFEKRYTWSKEISFVSDLFSNQSFFEKYFEEHQNEGFLLNHLFMNSKIQQTLEKKILSLQFNDVHYIAACQSSKNNDLKDILFEYMISEKKLHLIFNYLFFLKINNLDSEACIKLIQNKIHCFENEFEQILQITNQFDEYIYEKYLKLLKSGENRSSILLALIQKNAKYLIEYLDYIHARKIETNVIPFKSSNINLDSFQISKLISHIHNNSEMFQKQLFQILRFFPVESVIDCYFSLIDETQIDLFELFSFLSQTHSIIQKNELFFLASQLL